jgi:hypothetical protein
MSSIRISRLFCATLHTRLFNRSVVQKSTNLSTGTVQMQIENPLDGITVLLAHYADDRN